MKDKVEVSRFVFNQYWVGANLPRIRSLVSHEIDALVDHHWEMLLREVATQESLKGEEEKDVTDN